MIASYLIKSHKQGFPGDRYTHLELKEIKCEPFGKKRKKEFSTYLMNGCFIENRDPPTYVSLDQANQ